MIQRKTLVFALAFSSGISFAARAQTPESPAPADAAAEPASAAESDAGPPATSEAAPPTEAVTAAPTEGDAGRATIAPAAPHDEAEFLHAEAMEAELTQDFPRALELLRRAHELSPADTLVRFDLARVGILHGGTSDDLEPFLDTTLADPASLALRQAIEAEAAPPDQRLRLLDGRLTARLRIGTSIDTNVSIAPADDLRFEYPDGSVAPEPPPPIPTEELVGVRLVTDGQLAFTPLRGALSLDFAFGFRLGTFLNTGGGTLDEATGTRSARLERFDSNRVSLAALGRLDLEPVQIKLHLSGTEVSYANLNRHFMQTFQGGLEVLLGDANDHFGLYGNFGMRDFVDGNLEDSPEDRDGPYVGGGIAGTWNADGMVGFTGRLGVFREDTDGIEVDVHGAAASVALLVNADPVHADVGVSHQARVYGETGPGGWEDLKDIRVDNRLNPFLKVIVEAWQYVAIYGVYSYTNNLSTHDESIAPRAEGVPLHMDRTYQRHFIELGVEGRI